MQYEFNHIKFWEHVIGARVSRRLSQKQVGIELGVGGSTVSQWESGKRQLPAHRFMALCSVFDLDPMQYYREIDAPSWKQPRLMYDTPRSPYLTFEEIVECMEDARINAVDARFGYSYAEWVVKYQAAMSRIGAVS